MPHKSVASRTANLDRLLLSADRYVDAQLELHTSKGERLFAVGGCWDRIARRYVDRPVVARVVRLEESQDIVGRAIGDYLRKRLAGDPDRPIVLELIGNRGSGKTWLLGLLFLCVALAFPGAWMMGVSITSKQNRELKTALTLIGSPSWIALDITDFRDARTVLLTGAQILWQTSKNPKALRQALLNFELIAINEGQDQREIIFTNSIGAMRSGGLVAVATNPSQDAAGDWVTVVYQGIEAGSRDGWVFVLEAKLNRTISQPSMPKIQRLLEMVNPNAARADSEGVITLSGSVAYPGFSRKRREHDERGRWLSGHIGSPPDLGWVDITRKLTAEHSGQTAGFDYVAGSDFQTEPGNCAAVGKLYQTPGGIVLWIKEFVGSNGSEQDLTLALNSRGYFPGPVNWEGKPCASLVLVGDATGARQNSEHRKHDPYSFTRLRADGWTVLPPTFYGPKRTTWNPLVIDSRKQMKSAFLAWQILLSPACTEAGNGFPALIEGFARAKVNLAGKFDKKGHLTHGPDCVRYLAWRFLPKPTAPATPTNLDVAAFNRFAGLRFTQE